MKVFSQARRTLTIGRVLIRYGLDDQLFAVPALQPLRYLYRLMPWKWKKKEHPEPAVAMRCALEDLGPVFVKFGQVLSTRRDMLPERFADELARLQDKVPPFPSDQAHAIIEENFPEAAIHSRIAFYDAGEDKDLYKAREREMAESCARFIDFDNMDCLPMSEYIMQR